MMLCTGDTGIACLHTFPQPSETGPQGLGNGVSLLAHALQILQLVMPAAWAATVPSTATPMNPSMEP